MPDQKISTFTNATVLSGVEKLTGLQGGVNKNFELDLIADYIGASSGLLKVRKGLITSAEILSVSPFGGWNMVPAPGVGKMIVPIRLVLKYNYVSTTYVNGQLTLVYSKGGSSSSINNITTLLNTNSTYTLIVTASGSFITDIDNASIDLIIGATTPTVGQGSLEYYFYYTEETL